MFHSKRSVSVASSTSSSRKQLTFPESSFHKAASSSYSVQLSNRSSVHSSGQSQSFLSKKKQKLSRDIRLARENVYTVVDPNNKDIDRTPVPLVKDTVIQSSLPRRSSIRESVGSYTASGQVSPSNMSEISEIERFSSASWGMPVSASQTGSSTPSTSYLSDDESFFFNRGISLNESMTSVSTENISLVESKISHDLKEVMSQTKLYEEKELDEKVVMSQQEIEDWLEQDFVIDLKETPTFFLFEHYDEAVPGQAEYLEEVREKNKQFEEAIKRKQTQRELFTNKEVQTLNKFYKNKFSSTIKTETEDAEVLVSGWEIFDEYEKIREIEEKQREERESIMISNQGTKEDEEEEDTEQLGEEEENDKDDVLSVKSFASQKGMYSNPGIRDSLTTLERAVAQNLYHEHQLQYKALHDRKKVEYDLNPRVMDRQCSEEEDGYQPEEIGDSDEEVEESNIQSREGEDESSYSLRTLWNFECGLSEGHNVNCMSWNHSNRDILAVGYGNVGVGDAEGMIMCWTLKNPTFPERIIKIPGTGITAIDFSRRNPSLLSVGYNDGGVAIFDIRKNDQRPVLEAGKNHTGTVWDLQWIDRGKDIGERLHSVGNDGRVNSWSIKKGLECHEIMRLKSSGKSEQEGAVIARESGGMCIDFDRKDTKLYLVGTEDGLIKKCSTSYNEQCLETYQGHTGPVYRVRWNPFDPNTFLSCSADWTIRLWNQEKYHPLLTIESFSETMEKRSSCITDIAWCNQISTMFASVSITGAIDVWDMASSTLKPKYTKMSYGRQLNSVLYALDSPVLLVGDNFGTIEVLKPSGLSEDDFTQDISQCEFI